ncbi:hypothetical protein F5884DRAFT_758987 [Xylogone sp. PMI_703]|nr:hypothetical protein F5884DRAFT_758987 [Xylogone sp. PMI_703]
MHSLLSFPLLAALSAAQVVAAQTISFVNPGPAGANNDFSLDSTFVLGSKMNIQWTSDTDKNMDLTLNQQRPNDVWEYVFQNRPNLTSFDWTVTTNKNLADTPVFFFELWISGSTSPAAISHYFNITDGRSPSSSSSSTSSSTPTSTTPTSTPTSTPSSSSTNTGGSAASATNSSPPITASSSSGLSTGAKVGLGVGIPIAVILGVAAGWFFFGRRRRNQHSTRELLQSPNDYAPPQYGHYAPQEMKPFVPQSAPGTPQGPTEMAELGTGVTELPGSMHQR